jgi:predicted rRNA methylase YqxC with S4 and FtsJ domains
VDKRGVSRNPGDHIAAIERICEVLPQASLSPVALDFSPIKGQGGNIEYLLLAAGSNDKMLAIRTIQKVVGRAFMEL